MKISFFKLLIFLTIISFLIPLTVWGQITIPNPLEYETLQELVDKLIDFIFAVAIAITPLVLIYAGFLFLTAGGDPQKVNQAKSLIFWALIGLTIVILAKGLIKVLQDVLGVTPT